jgi:hypothetical protein
MPGQVSFDMGPRFCMQAAPVTRYLPWRTGPEAALSREDAERLHVLSLALRRYMQQSTPAGDVRPDPAKLRRMLASGEVSIFPGVFGVRPRPTPAVRGRLSVPAIKGEWHTPEAIPTLMQLLQAEDRPLRLLLVETLAEIKGEKASVALAQRAIYDLSEEVRKKAAEALSKRPSAEFEQVLLEAFRYPWAPAAEHAAECIVALRMKHLVPKLIPLLKEPDPTLPFEENNQKMVRQLVRMNHLCNCIVCHAPSTSREDLVRGLVPMPGAEMPPVYYQAVTGVFVRASITFLRQDFSVMQPVPEPGKWPTYQRYDYLILKRPVTPPKDLRLTQKKKKKDGPPAFIAKDPAPLTTPIGKDREELPTLTGKNRSGDLPTPTKNDQNTAPTLTGKGPDDLPTIKKKDSSSSTPAEFEQRKALLFTLRELTGQDRGNTFQDWQPLLQAIPKEGSR